MPSEIKNTRLLFSCDQSWDNMRPSSNGRFCEGCKKEVVDFTDKTSEDYQRIISESTGNVCGRFRKEQTVHATKLSFWQKAAAALVFIAGPLSGKLYAQKDTIFKQPNSLSIDTTRYEVLGEISPMPQYKGGTQAMMDFVKANLKRPENCPTGRVYTSFDVDSTGKVSNVKITRGLRKDADEEALRVIRLLVFEPYRRSTYDPHVIKFNLPVYFTGSGEQSEEK